MKATPFSLDRAMRHDLDSDEFDGGWAARTRDLLDPGDSPFAGFAPRAVDDERSAEDDPAATKSRRGKFSLPRSNWISRW